MERNLKLLTEKLPFTEKFLEGRTRVNHRRMRIISDMLIKRGFDIRRAKILEVGSYIGFGLIAAETSNLSFGLEYYFENCRRASYIASVFDKKEIHFIQGTAAALPFGSDIFDYIQTNHVIEHMPPEFWDIYIFELHRVLKPDGICLISFPHRHNPIELHYGLPFLHWLPTNIRKHYARLTTKKAHIENAKKAYESVVSGKEELIFTELPSIQRVKNLVEKHFRRNEDVTREFANHPLIRNSLGPLKHKLAVLLSNTWICPERKLFLYK